MSSFIILLSGEGLSSFNKDNFSGESKVQWSFPGYLLFENVRKKLYFKTNFLLVAVPVLESKAL